MRPVHVRASPTLVPDLLPRSFRMVGYLDPSIAYLGLLFFYAVFHNLFLPSFIFFSHYTCTILSLPWLCDIRSYYQ